MFILSSLPHITISDFCVVFLLFGLIVAMQDKIKNLQTRLATLQLNNKKREKEEKEKQELSEKSRSKNATQGCDEKEFESESRKLNFLEDSRRLKDQIAMLLRDKKKLEVEKKRRVLSATIAAALREREMTEYSLGICQVTIYV